MKAPAAKRCAPRRSILRRAMRPALVLPVLFAAALLAFGFSVSDARRVASEVGRIPLRVVAGTLVLALGYLLLKLAEFAVLLRGLGIRSRFAHLLLAFAVGEITLPVPGGIYAQNYVLRHLHRRAGFARSSAATTAMLAIETLLVFAVLAVLPIPAWGWLRPLSALMLLLTLALALVVLRAPLPQRVRRLSGWPALARLRGALREMLTGLRALATPGWIGLGSGLAATYLFALVLGFFLVSRGIGAPGVGLRQAVTIYAFSLFVVLLIGSVVPQLGAAEVAGLGAAHAWGYAPSDALAMMVGFRLVWTGSVWFWCAPVVGLLWGELGQGAARDEVDDAPP